MNNHIDFASDYSHMLPGDQSSVLGSIAEPIGQEISRVHRSGFSDRSGTRPRVFTAGRLLATSRGTGGLM